MLPTFERNSLIFVFLIIKKKIVTQDVFYCDKKSFKHLHFSIHSQKKEFLFIISPYNFFKCSCINFLLHTSVLSQKKKLKNFSLIFKSCILCDAGSMHHFVFVSLSTSICFSIYHITSFISKFTDMHKNKYVSY